MHDALTLRGQVAALVADLHPHIGGSMWWWGGGESHARREGTTQNSIVMRMTAGREYSIRDIAALMPGKSICALRSAVATLIKHGRITFRVLSAAGKKAESNRPVRLYSRTNKNKVV